MSKGDKAPWELAGALGDLLMHSTPRKAVQKAIRGAGAGATRADLEDRIHRHMHNSQLLGFAAPLTPLNAFLGYQVPPQEGEGEDARLWDALKAGATTPAAMMPGRLIAGDAPGATPRHNVGVGLMMAGGLLPGIIAAIEMVRRRRAKEEGAVP